MILELDGDEATEMAKLINARMETIVVNPQKHADEIRILGSISAKSVVALLKDQAYLDRLVKDMQN